MAFDLVFCGTPQFAVPTLEKLFETFNVRLVVTQPDRPKGRGLEVVASPVKQAAEKLGLPIYQPEKIKQNEELCAKLEAIHPDAIIVVGYGRIIPSWMLQLPEYGNINLHASLLPKYRGAAPIQWAIANGETVTGVTTMRIDSFFSSRRRHTRSTGDWSSDVCSSDLRSPKGPRRRSSTAPTGPTPPGSSRS